LKIQIYRKAYDNPLKEDGTEKENEFLGEFELLETIEEDTYSSSSIGERNGKIYFINQKETKYGSFFSVDELNTLQKRID
jgi:hypothetical protein